MSNYNRFSLGQTVTVFDQFCGAGGSSSGAQLLGMRVDYAVNHSEIAIATHSKNFPKTGHDLVDISKVNPRRYRRTNVLITSPECDQHTSASGVKRLGQPDLFGDTEINEKADRSRATAWDVVRFAEVHKYEAIVVENVHQFHDWILFSTWLDALQKLDYEYEIVYMNAMFAHMDPSTVSRRGDFVPQSRDRMFVVLWKKGMRAPDLNFYPKAFCTHCGADVDAVQSWKRENRRWGKWGAKGQYVYRCPTCTGIVTPYYYAAANILDWEIPIQRIGDRPIALKPKTMDRIQAGIDRYWSGKGSLGPTGLIVATDHDKRQAESVLEHLPTQTTHQSLGLVMPTMVTMRATDGQDKNARGYYRVQPVTDVMPTQVAAATQTWMLGLPFLALFRNHQDASSIDEPLHTVTAGGVHHGLIVTYNGNSVSKGIGESLPAVTTIDRHSLVITSERPEIDECLFRMLTPAECALAQSFSEDYIILGTKRQQVEQIGNANPPRLMSAILDRVAPILQ